MEHSEINHYVTLGLDHRCTAEQIRAAYRLLAKQHHPDFNPGSTEALRRTQELNAAHEILSDLGRRLDYDRQLDAGKNSAAPRRAARKEYNISQDVNLRIEEFFRGTAREVRVNDPVNPQGAEIYQFIIPPNTAPGARFRLPRAEPFDAGFIQIRVRALPSFQFKVRGSDLRCDLKLKTERAAQGGMEMLPGVAGGMLRVPIPRGVGRNEIIRLPGEGLPKPRGGRGDLLVRITYRPEVRVARSSGR